MLFYSGSFDLLIPMYKRAYVVTSCNKGCSAINEVRLLDFKSCFQSQAALKGLELAAASNGTSQSTSPPPNFSPDAFRFGPNSPDPPLSPSKSDPPPSHPGITTQNLANGAVTTPKIAPGVVSTEIFGPATVPPDTGEQLEAKCPSGTVVSGGGFRWC